MDLAALLEDAIAKKQAAHDAWTRLMREAIGRGEELRQLRGRRSQVQIAQAASVPQPYVSMLESGNAGRLPLDALQRMLQAYRKGTGDGNVHDDHDARRRRPLRHAHCTADGPRP